MEKWPEVKKNTQQQQNHDKQQMNDGRKYLAASKPCVQPFPNRIPNKMNILLVRGVQKVTDID